MNNSCMHYQAAFGYILMHKMFLTFDISIKYVAAI